MVSFASPLVFCTARQRSTGQVIRFIAKRGEVGLHMALTDAGYDVKAAYKHGIWGSGRVAYRKTEAERMRV